HRYLIRGRSKTVDSTLPRSVFVAASAPNVGNCKGASPNTVTSTKVFMAVHRSHVQQRAWGQGDGRGGGPPPRSHLRISTLRGPAHRRSSSRRERLQARRWP